MRCASGLPLTALVFAALCDASPRRLVSFAGIHPLGFFRRGRSTASMPSSTLPGLRSRASRGRRSGAARFWTSRVDVTRAIAEAIVAAPNPPALVNGSAVGWYGSRGDEVLGEDAGRGDGVLADVCAAWEASAAIAAPVTRVAMVRTGLVIGDGGAVTPMKLATKFGLGSRIGSGQGWWPWISLHDEVAAIVHLALRSSLTGAVNPLGQCQRGQKRSPAHAAAALGRPHALVVPTSSRSAPWVMPAANCCWRVNDCRRSG